MPVVRVERDFTLGIDFGIGRLGYRYSMAVSAECDSAVAGSALVAEGYSKLKRSVGNIDY